MTRTAHGKTSNADNKTPSTPQRQAAPHAALSKLLRPQRILRVKHQLLPHRYIQQPVRHDNPRLHIPLARHLLEPRPKLPFGRRRTAQQVHGFRLSAAILLHRRRFDGGAATGAVDLENGAVRLGNILKRIDPVGNVGRAIDGQAPKEPAAVGARPVDRLLNVDAEPRLGGLVD